MSPVSKDRQTQNEIQWWGKGEVDKEQWGQKCDARSRVELTMAPFGKWPACPWGGWRHWLRVPSLSALATGCIVDNNKKTEFPQDKLNRQRQSDYKTGVLPFAGVCFTRHVTALKKQKTSDIQYTESWRPNKLSSSWQVWDQNCFFLSLTSVNHHILCTL